MKFWDWAQLGLTGTTSLADYKGAYKITAGTALGAYFGGRHTHVFGPEVKMVVDPADMLLQSITPCKKLAALSGLTSNATFVYGSSTSATYIGPKVDIQRAPKISRVSTKFTTRPGVGRAGTWTENPPNPADQEDPLDTASASSVALLSLLAVATAAALELAMYIHYRQFTDMSQGPGPGPKVMATASYAVPSRLLALIKVIETAACYGSWAEVSMIRAGEVAIGDAIVTTCREQAAAVQAAYVAWQARRAEQARLAALAAQEAVAEEE